MSEHPYIIQGSEENFAEVVIAASAEQPVLVDFWADWCAPCKSLMPVLEKLAHDYAGAFTLVKVNSDEQQALAAQFGVRSLPTVKLFKDGQPVDEFMGALPESQVKEFLDKHVENAIDGLANEAILALHNGNQDAAQAAFNRIFEANPQHLPSLIALTQHAIDEQKYDDAAIFLKQISPADATTTEVVKLAAQLKLAQGSDGQDINALKTAVETNGKDLAARMALGNAYIAQGEYQAGLEQYFVVIQQDRGFEDDAGRSAVLNVFNLLGGQDPIVKAARRQLASLLN